MGWYWEGARPRERREGYGDVGDHCLISRAEARSHLAEMELKLEDGEEYMINNLAKTKGYTSIILPEVPNWCARRNAARKLLGLPLSLTKIDGRD